MSLNIPSFTPAKVLVIGDVMLDRYWHGPTSRISPEAPVPVVRVDTLEARPGGAANVALNIACLGAQAILLGVTGQDEPADLLRQQLGAAGVISRFTSLAEYATVTKLRVISRHQQLIRLDFEDGFAGLDPNILLPAYTQALSEVGAVVLSDYGKGGLTATRALIEQARALQLPVLVDPKGTDFARYRGATLITPNFSEFEAVVGPCSTEQQIVERGLALIKTHNLDALLVTRGEQGMTLLCDGQATHLPTRARDVYDVTGAGDTVIGVLAATLAAGEPLQASTALANLAAGIVVGKLGTATVTVDELRQGIYEQVTKRGIVDESQLRAQISAARLRGEKIVMTNGCFDLLHPGHVRYLEQAHALGNRLVVAVNDDASVARLKGAARPINPLAARLEMLAALRVVDWVVPFSEDTPERLICELTPDVLVKGGDYVAEQIAGYQCVMEHGGQVKVLTFVDGYSTTKMLDKINKG